MNFPKQKNRLFACVLSLPILIFFAGYLFNHSNNIHPTGFIQYDNVSYVAYAKQYLDADSFHLQYSNPFNDAEASPIYFQTQTLLFAFLLKIGIAPGLILIPFTIICSLICFRLLIAIYDLLIPENKFRTLNIWLLSWGGGLLTAAGVIAHFYLHDHSNLLDGIFILDPEHGWWGLNFGRSLFFTCEAYFHALFLGCIYCLLKQKWIIAFILLLGLSLSHPFTGIELIGIVCLWCIVEFFYNKKEIPLWFMAGVLFTLCFHIYYYLFYLNQFPDHKSVSDQYTLNWRLRFYRMIPAYCIVGALAVASVYTASFKKFFRLRSNRIFACWFIVAFLLANHEIFIKARQPIHFTRGYIWTSLFLLGLPALMQFNQYLKNKYKKLGLIAFASIFFADNFLWIFNHIRLKAIQPYATYITDEQKQLLELLDKESTNKTLIVSSDETVAYLSSVYTKAYPWYSHPYTTPFAKRKRTAQNNLFERGNFDSLWMNREVNYVVKKTDTIAKVKLLTLPLAKILSTNNYMIFEYMPRKKF